jgi:hypothetical protein
MFTLANTVSPVLAAGVCHLIGLNLLIALVEAWMIRSAAERPWRVVYGRVLGANILSAFIGIFAVDVFGSSIGSVLVPEGFPTHGVEAYLLAMIGSMFVLTLVVEVPAIVWMFRQADAVRLRRIAARFALANVLTYVLLAFVYWNMMPFELPKGLTMASTSAVARDPDARLFWVSGDGAVFERKLGAEAQAPTQVGKLPRDREMLWIQVDPKRHVWSVSDTGSSSVLASGSLSDTSLPADLSRRPGHHYDVQSTPGVPLKMGVGRQDFRGGSIELAGLDGKSVSRAFVMYLPGLVRRFDIQALLPDEQIILAVDDHLYLYDVRENRLAYLAEGSSTVVVPSARPAQ